MHEIRATVPPELTEEAARLAHAAGIERVSIAEVFIHGPGLIRRIRERRHLHAEGARLCRCAAELPRLFGDRLSVTSREVRSIVNSESLDSLTGP